METIRTNGSCAFVERRFSPPADMNWRPIWPPSKNMVVAIILAGSMFLAACGMMGPAGEQVRQQPQKTVYKSADETEPDQAKLAPVQKVPGE
jgi:predicted small secreted protein